MTEKTSWLLSHLKRGTNARYESFIKALHASNQDNVIRNILREKFPQDASTETGDILLVRSVSMYQHII